MAEHPIDAVYVDNVPVAKSDVRGYVKEHSRVAVADAAEVNNGDFTGQYGGLYVRDLDDEFNYDPADTTTPDDGLTCLVDDVGNRFKIRVIAGTASPPNYREVTAAGAITVSAADDIIGVNKTVGAATTVNLGTAAARNGKPITIKDVKGDASSNNITFATSGGQLIDGLDPADWAIVTDKGSITFYPKTGGWFTTA